MQTVPVNAAQQTSPSESVAEASKDGFSKEEDDVIPENLLGYSEAPMDEGTAASLSAMFADDDD